MTEHLSEAHRTTLGHLDRHPTTHNLEWHDVRSLLEAVGDVTEEHNGKVRVTVGDQTLTITPPRHKDVDEPTLLEIRRLLHAAGYRADPE